MKKREPCWATALVLGLFAASVLATTSCEQDAIFSIISGEVAPQPPLIEGGPTQMIVFDWPTPDGTGNDAVRPVMFVASGGLFWYAPERRDDVTREWDNTTARWRPDIGITQPPGRIIDIAATQRFLYALTGDGINNTLRRTNSGMNGVWEVVGGPSGSMQSIFADGERLFAGIRTGSIGNIALYGIYSVHDGAGALAEVEVTVPEGVTNTRLLTGAVRDGTNYFLSTSGGSFRFDGTTAIQLRNASAAPDEEGEQPFFTGSIVGMIRLPDNSIIAVGRGGSLHMVSDNSLALIPRTNADGPIPDQWMNTGRFATGALAIWEGHIEGEEGRKVLAVGVQESLTTTTFRNGYVEFTLHLNGSLNTGDPPRVDNLASVQGEHDQYRTSLRREPINHLFQAPREIDYYMTFFASTQTAGLWSFRDRPGEGGWQWNAEN